MVTAWAIFYKKWQRLKRIAVLFIRADKTFIEPKRQKILVIDAEGEKTLLPLFDDVPYEVLHLRNEKINLNAGLWLNVMISFWKTKNLRFAYALEFVKKIQPSIAITFVDNSQLFQMLDKELNCASLKFMAIQNGRRALARDHLINNSPIFHSHFFCFGQYEVDQYKVHGAEVRQFHPCGSLKDSYYRELVDNLQPKLSSDVVFISEGWFDTSYDSPYGAAKSSFELLCTYLKRYLEEHNISVFVACRSEQGDVAYDRELNDLRKLLGTGVTYIPNCRKEFISYRLTDATNTVLGTGSTLLLEAFGRGRKILSVNYTGDPSYDFSVSGFWCLSNPGYAKFEKSLTLLLSMSPHEYKKNTQPKQAYALSYNRNSPTHYVLKNFIRRQLIHDV